MHGLNTYQAVYYATPTTRLSSTGSDVEAAVFTQTSDDPAFLQGTLFSSPAPPSDTTEYYMKRGYNKYTFVNTRPYPCYMECLKLRAKTSIPKNAAFPNVFTAISSILSDGNSPGFYISPFISPTTSPTLHKWFKITGRTRTLMKPGHPYTHTQRMQRAYFRRYISPIAEGNTGDYVLLKGSSVYFYRFYGVPMYNKASESDTTLTDVRVVQMNRTYLSWYRMDDADVTNTVAQTLPSDRNVSLGYPFPTQYHHEAILGGNESDGRMNNVEYVGILNTPYNSLLGTTSSAPVHTVTP